MQTLLCLIMFTASVCASVAAPTISAEVKECFEWFGTLGYPDVKQAVFAEVWTGNWYQSGLQSPATVTLLGFVTAKNGGHFDVVGVDLVQRELSTNDKPAKPEERIGYEPRPFTEYARQQLNALRQPPKGNGNRFGAKLGLKSEAFFLAYVCWRKGEQELAQSLFDETRKIAPISSGGNGKSDIMKVSIEKEFAYYAMWDAVLQCGGGRLGVDEWAHSGKLVPRTELLLLFQNVVKHFPLSEHIGRAKKTIAVLERMIAEDKVHPVITDVAFAKLPADEQVRELIFRLRDQNGHQWDQPGGCDILDMRDAETSAAHRLVKSGYDAVPQLIDALTDERFSRSVRFGRDFHFSHTVLTIGDCAQQILNRISGRSFNAPRRTSGLMSRDEEIAAKQKVASDWWAEFKAKGERQTLVDAIASGTEDPWPLIPKLKAKYPEAVADAVLTGAAKAKEHWLVHRFVDFVGDIKTDAARDYLIRQLDGGQTIPIRLAAARQLWNRDHPSVVEHVINIWQNLPETANRSPDDGSEPTIEFLCKCGRTAAIEALATDIDQRSGYQRFLVVERLGELLAAKGGGHSFYEMAARKPEPSAKSDVIALLARRLEDTDVEEGLGGGRGDFQFTNPRICDFAMWAMHQVEPDVYAFSNKATRGKRDEERITAANVWRKMNAKPMLPVPTVTLPVLKESESLRITSIAFKPVERNKEVSEVFAKLKGTFFTPKTISTVLLWFARNEVKDVRGLSIEATHEGDLRGVALDIKITPGDYPPAENRVWATHYNVCANDNSMGISGGRAAASDLEKDDAWRRFEDDVEKALKAPSNVPWVITAGLTGR